MQSLGGARCPGDGEIFKIRAKGPEGWEKSRVGRSEIEGDRLPGDGRRRFGLVRALGGRRKTSEK